MASVMRGYNLWTWRDYVMFLIESRMDSSVSADLVEPVLFRFLNDSHLEACRSCGFRRSAEIPVDITLGVSEYPIPTSVLADRIVHVRYLDQGVSWVPLTYVSPDMLADLCPDDTITGTPRYYTAVPASRIFKLGPTPKETGTGSLRLVAEVLPDPLHRLYRSSKDAVTVSITNGSQIAVLSGTVSGVISPGDEFGIVPTSQTDASAVPDATPIMWNAIQTVPSPLVQLTLSEPYTGATVSGANFITAQVPSIEAQFPGMFGYNIAQLAVSRILSTRSPEESDRLRADAILALSSQSDSTWRGKPARTGVAFRTSMIQGF